MVSGVDYSQSMLVVRNFEEFASSIVERGMPSFVSFDHDLADEHYVAMLKESVNYGSEKTGYDCAKRLVEYCHDNNLPFPPYVVHSMNPVGKERIEKYIVNAIRKEYIKIS